MKLPRCRLKSTAGNLLLVVYNSRDMIIGSSNQLFAIIRVVMFVLVVVKVRVEFDRCSLLCYELCVCVHYLRYQLYRS